MNLPHAWKTKDFVFVRDRFGLVIQLTHEDAYKLRDAISLMVEPSDPAADDEWAREVRMCLHS